MPFTWGVAPGWDGGAPLALRRREAGPIDHIEGQGPDQSHRWSVTVVLSHVRGTDEQGRTRANTAKMRWTPIFISQGGRARTNTVGQGWEY